MSWIYDIYKLYKMRIISRNIQKFANLNTQFAVNKNRDAVRFESQNLNWDY